MSDNEPLKAQIEAAFRDAPRPEPDALVVSIMKGDLEGENFYWKIRDLRWEDVPANLSLFIGGPIFFLSAEGLHYFLPGFVMAGLEKYDHFFDFVVGSLIFCLHPPAEDGLKRDEVYRRYRHEEFDRLGSLMTRSQISALCSFLNYLRKRDPRDFESDHFFMETVAYWCKNTGSRTSQITQ